MHITLKDTFDETIENAIKIAKENHLDVIFERDGTHGTADLGVIVKFVKAGFAYDIKTYKGVWEDEAIRVIFVYVGK